MPITETLKNWLETRAEATIGEVALLDSGRELRHRDDRGITPELLTTLGTLAQLREIVRTTADGAFRPLRAAPTLRRGWRFECAQRDDLVAALNVIYPAALAFWLRTVPPTEFAETAGRQTGMYHITRKLTPEQLAATIADVCHKGCLRQRLWKPASNPPERAENEIPLLCVEACNYFVAKARARVIDRAE